MPLWRAATMAEPNWTSSCDTPSPTVRLDAAAYVMKWAPNEAIPVIEKIMLWADDDRTEHLFGESMNVE